MNRLKTQKRVSVLNKIAEGCSILATCRMEDVAKRTVIRLVQDVGYACQRTLDENLINLPCKRIECDEIWAFCYGKEKNMRKKEVPGRGDIWTYIAICPETRLVPSYLLSTTRDSETAVRFLSDLKSRLANRIQLTTDGHIAYADAVDYVFANNIDFAMLQKAYGRLEDPDTERKYSPPGCTQSSKRVIIGNPDPQYISTSHVERFNQTLRMSMRRYARLTNGHSKKMENHYHALSFFILFYNYCRIHESIRVTPAMEAGLTDRQWTIEDVVRLL